MRTVVVAPPASLPVSIEEAKRHARIPTDLTDDGTDQHLDMLIRAATSKLEAMVDRALVTQTLETTYVGPIGDRWRTSGAGGVSDGSWRLPRADVTEIVSVGYLDRSGVAQAIDPALYRSDLGAPGRLFRPSGVAWPSGESLSVRYVAGYGGPEDVPADAKLIICILVAEWYGRREMTAQGQFSELPKRVDALADSLRWGGYP
ncbi:head-tail connector protein [Paludisphaera sp.]|uniref:head-tail connector protein n=1 Tax=Paludisphaera sp. TaxID=2017432 RepID=UPI00301C102F